MTMPTDLFDYGLAAAVIAAGFLVLREIFKWWSGRQDEDKRRDEERLQKREALFDQLLQESTDERQRVQKCLEDLVAEGIKSDAALQVTLEKFAKQLNGINAGNAGVVDGVAATNAALQAHEERAAERHELYVDHMTQQTQILTRFCGRELEKGRGDV